MGRSPTPEGVQRLNDLLTDIGQIGMEMVKAKARIHAQSVAQAQGLVAGSPAAQESCIIKHSLKGE